MAIPVLDEFIDECECRAVGSKGLGSLVAATGSWRSGTEGTAVIGAAVNASTFVARALRVLAEDTFVLEFGGEKSAVCGAAVHAGRELRGLGDRRVDRARPGPEADVDRGRGSSGVAARL